MNRFAIITDSSTDLPQKVVEELDVAVLPLRYTIQGEERPNWPDHREMDPHEFYDLLRKGERATTAALNSHDYVEMMTPFLDDGQDVLALVFSSGLSTTYQSSVIAAEELREKYPDRKIYVVDTLAASLGQGLLVWYACKKRDEGLSLEELYAWVEENKFHLCHWFTVDDLMYLKRGGRISAATALLGTMLNVKPVLHMDDEGHLISMSKARGRKAAIAALAKKLGELGEGYDNSTVFICHGDCLEDAKYLEKLVREDYGVKEVYINYTGAVIGSHSGPGTLSLFFMGKHR